MDTEEYPFDHPSQNKLIWPQANFGDEMFQKQIEVLKKKYHSTNLQIIDDESCALACSITELGIDGGINLQPRILKIPEHSRSMLDRLSPYDKMIFEEKLPKKLLSEGQAEAARLAWNTQQDILKLNKEYLQRAANKPIPEPVYIAKGFNGYEYEGKTLTFNEQGIYGEVFEIIFNFCKQGGYVTYDHIEEQLEQLNRGRREGEKRNTRITNALSRGQGFLKYAKIDGKSIPITLPNGKKLFVIKKGYGIQFNNLK